MTTKPAVSQLIQKTAHNLYVCNTNTENQIVAVLERFAAALRERSGEPAAPMHAFEVRISIGGETWDYVVRTLDELADHIALHGPGCNMCSGGAGGSHSVTIAERDITPEAYRAELEEWRQSLPPAPDSGGSE
jgi:hypothetical protein